MGRATAATVEVEATGLAAEAARAPRKEEREAEARAPVVRAHSRVRW